MSAAKDFTGPGFPDELNIRRRNLLQPPLSPFGQLDGQDAVAAPYCPQQRDEHQRRGEATVTRSPASLAGVRNSTSSSTAICSRETAVAAFCSSVSPASSSTSAGTITKMFRPPTATTATPSTIRMITGPGGPAVTMASSSDSAAATRSAGVRARMLARSSTIGRLPYTSVAGGADGRTGASAGAGVCARTGVATSRTSSARRAAIMARAFLWQLAYRPVRGTKGGAARHRMSRRDHCRSSLSS